MPCTSLIDLSLTATLVTRQLLLLLVVVVVVVEAACPLPLLLLSEAARLLPVMSRFIAVLGVCVRLHD